LVIILLCKVFSSVSRMISFNNVRFLDQFLEWYLHVHAIK
jgi:hypothetical protein